MRKSIFTLSIVSIAAVVAIAISSCKSAPEPEAIPQQVTYKKVQPQTSEGSGTSTPAPEVSGTSVPSGSGTKY